LGIQEKVWKYMEKPPRRKHRKQIGKKNYPSPTNSKGHFGVVLPLLLSLLITLLSGFSKFILLCSSA